MRQSISQISSSTVSCTLPRFHTVPQETRDFPSPPLPHPQDFGAQISQSCQVEIILKQLKNASILLLHYF